MNIDDNECSCWATAGVMMILFSILVTFGFHTHTAGDTQCQEIVK